MLVSSCVCCIGTLPFLMLSPYSSLPSDDNVVSGAISTGGGLPFGSLSGDSTPDSVYVRKFSLHSNSH